MFGNVAAQRKSLENKAHEQSVEKPPRKSLEIKGTTAEIRKSLENLDDKKGAPPPVASKKPVVPIKKSPSITSVTNNLFSGLKQKVKGVENKLAHDTHDGSAGSKPGAHVADNSDRGVVGEKIKNELEFDQVERTTILQDMRANRAKAPRRRPPSSAMSSLGDSQSSMNGSTEHAPESPRHEINVHHTEEGEIVKPKTREWEKHKVPWMDELKASQAKKTSPGGHHPESKSPDPIHNNNSTEQSFDMSKSYSSSFVSHNKNIKTSENLAGSTTTTSTVELRAHSVEAAKSNSFETSFSNNNRLTANSADNPIMIKSMPIVGARISITEKENHTSTTNHQLTNDKLLDVEKSPHSGASVLRNRSISPLGRRSLNMTSSPQHHPESSMNQQERITELEDRIAKLEKYVYNQNTAIDELKKLLNDESTKVKILKLQLEKYAQCVTQV